MIFPRQGLVAFAPKVLRNVDSSQGAGHVARAWNEWDADAAFVDNTGGYGAGWIDRLVELNWHPTGIGFADKASDPRYYNKRTEMYIEGIEWIRRGGCLPDDPEIVEELSQMTYTFKGDRMLLEPKEVLKARIGRSCDKSDAWCLVAGTLIATPTGECRIEKMREGDLVLTPFGTATVKHTWRSATGRLTTVKFSDGARLCGKPDHGIFAFGYGKVHLDALSLTMAVSPLSRRDEWLSASAWFTKARHIGFNTLVDTLPRGALSTASVCCIAAYGRSTTDLFQRALRSITLMVTGAIAPLRTWNVCLADNTENFILKSGGASGSSPSSLNWPDKGRQNGTPRMRAALGILAMEQKRGKDGNGEELRVSSARAHFGAFSQHWRNFVRTHAHKLMDISATKRLCERAIGAGKHLWRIATGKQPVVPVSVLTENVPPTSVYNLTLDRDNAYYANGILVFNCLTFAEPVMRKRASVLPTREERGSDGRYDPFKSMIGGR